MLVIAPEPADKLKAYWAKQGYQFAAVADPQGTLLNLLGQETHWRKFGRMPALLAVAAEGRIVQAHWGQNMKDTPDFAAIALHWGGP